MAFVCTNNNLPSSFQPQHSMRQGYPLSLLLLSGAIEPLTLRECATISGICGEGLDHKVSLYVDDMLLHKVDLVASFPLLVTILSEFGTMATRSNIRKQVN